MYDCGVIHLHAFSRCAFVFVVLFAVVCWCLGLIWSVRARSPLAHPASFDGLGQPSSAIPRACSVVLRSVGWLAVGAGSLLVCFCVVCLFGSVWLVWALNGLQEFGGHGADLVSSGRPWLPACKSVIPPKNI